jgi:hypothetical protein
LHILTPNGTYSKLLNTFSSYILRLDRLKKSLRQESKTDNKKTSIGDRSKP